VAELNFQLAWGSSSVFVLGGVSLSLLQAAKNKEKRKNE